MGVVGLEDSNWGTQLDWGAQAGGRIHARDSVRLGDSGWGQLGWRTQGWGTRAGGN